MCTACYKAPRTNRDLHAQLTRRVPLYKRYSSKNCDVRILPTANSYWRLNHVGERTLPYNYTYYKAAKFK